MNTLFPLSAPIKAHPAKYTNALFGVLVDMLRDSTRVLDPFGGTGKIFLLNRWLPELKIEALEIEPEWARANPRTTVGNALHLPWPDNSFDAICTSPTYGNRMADGLRQSVLDGRWTTMCYADKLGRKLHLDNSGGMQWGDQYRKFHIAAWLEARRVLVPGGVFILNIKNHIRGGKEQYVARWHMETLESLGFAVVRHEKVACPGMRYGQNTDLRVEYESVIKFISEKTLDKRTGETK